MDHKLSSLLNEQINKEFYSAYLYLAVHNWFAERNLGGFAAYYGKQAAEEQQHALKLSSYLHDNGEKVELGALAAPAVSFQSAKDAVAAVLAHEKSITASIEHLYETALELKDYRTQLFLGWYVTEQCEEEKNAQDQLDRVALLGDHPVGLYSLDKEAGAAR